MRCRYSTPAVVFAATFATVIAVGGWLGGPSSVRAQSDGTGGLCDLLLASEVSDALGAAATVGFGGDADCTYEADGLQLELALAPGALDDLRAPDADYAEVTVAGETGLLAPDGTELIVQVQDDLLSFLVRGTPPDTLDPATALPTLASTAIGRLATISLPTPIPAATAGPLCGLLSDAEVGAALTEAISVVTSSDLDECDYLVDPTASGTSVTMRRTLDTLGGIRQSFVGSGLHDVTVAGLPGLLSANPDLGISLYLQTTEPSLLQFHLFTDRLDAQAAQGAIQVLGALAVGRIGSVPLPAGSAALGPTAATVDAALAALFPPAVGGASVVVRALTEDEVSGYDAALADMGLGPDDVTFATADVPSGSVTAIRVPGAAADLILDFAAELGGGVPDPAASPETLADRDVVRLPDSTDATGASSRYLYAADDVLWLIAADATDTAQILTQLP